MPEIDNALFPQQISTHVPDDHVRKEINTANAVSSNRFDHKSELRRFKRETLKLPVRLQMQDREISGYTQEFSPGGLRLVIDSSLKPGTSLALQCSFGGVCYLNISGQVIYCLPLDNELAGSFSVGVKFSAIRQWEETILTSTITELRQNVPTQGKSLLTICVSKDALAAEAASIAIHSPRSLEDWISPPRRSCIHASKIIGWGSYLPEKEITNQEISSRATASNYKNVGEVVETLTGIKSRRYATHEQYPSDLAEKAAREALKNAGVDPQDLEVIIFFGISRDFHEPATANVVQEKLGATNAYVYDLANACNGFITAVDTLDSMIAAGRCENGLVVTGELISPYIDWQPKTKRDFKLSIFGYTIGDSGGAAVLTRVQPGENRGIRARWFHSAGSQWRLALAGELEGANENNKYFRSQGRELEETSIKIMPAGFQEITQMLGWSISDIDLVIPHQIPTSILENMYHKAVGIPLEKLFWTFPHYGNLATASMPVAACEAMKSGKVRPGDKVLLAGAAAGFSAGYIGLVL